jgi:hypothetical protein
MINMYSVELHFETEELLFCKGKKGSMNSLHYINSQLYSELNMIKPQSICYEGQLILFCGILKNMDDEYNL